MPNVNARQLIFKLIFLAIMLQISMPAFAASCPADLQNDIDIQCSSGDITIAQLAATNPDQYCLAGTQVSLDLDVEMESGNNAKRPDIAVMFSLDGKTLQTTSANGGALSCSTSVLDTLGTIIGNEDADNCNDLLQGNQGATFTQSIADAINVDCNAEIGGAEVFSMIGWKTGTSGDTCSLGNLFDDNDGLYAFNDAQCSAGSNIVPLNVIGTLTIVKEAEPPTDGLFNFESDGCELAGLLDDGTCNPIASFDLPGNGGEQVLYQVLDTPISVSEIGGIEGYGLASIICLNDATGNMVATSVNDPQGDPNLTVSLDGMNPNVTCTFFNSEGGTIIIEKDTVPDGPQDFSFTGTDGDGYDFNGGFSLDDDADGDLSNMASFIGVDPGTYTVTEAAAAGFDLTGLSCNDPDQQSVVDLGSSTATIDVDAGETITCIFTNTQRALLTLVKNLPNDNGGTATQDDFQAYWDGNPVDWDVPTEVLPNQEYVASEDVLNGYDPGNGWFNACASGGAVTPAPGDDLTCEITNDDISPNLTLVKIVDNGSGGEAFVDDWNLAADGPTPINGDGGVSSDVDAGNYDLSESGPEIVTGGLYVASDWVCEGSGTPNGASISLSLGDIATCTITNQFVPSVPVPASGIWATLLLILSILAGGWYFRPATMRRM